MPFILFHGPRKCDKIISISYINDKRDIISKIDSTGRHILKNRIQLLVKNLKRFSRVLIFNLIFNLGFIASLYTINLYIINRAE